jgi:3-dehydroquinate synthase
MGDLLVHNFIVQSHAGPYSVEFNNDIISTEKINQLGSHFIIDKNVYNLLDKNFSKEIDNKCVVLIDATENTKSFLGLESIIQSLVDNKLKRDSHLVAIGGGITQDITCFIANNYMRGIKWTFIPTTLLAQADSCIGSKSSINFGKIKNLLGSFTPPNRVIISNQFLKTLEEKDIRSGIGEIVKLYFIDNKFIDLETISKNLPQHIFNTLIIKKKYIEEDEFDVNIRNILNYGHCFGHAIESACNYSIPHGIAVAMGMDIVNRISLNLNLIDEENFYKMNTILNPIYNDYTSTSISSSVVFNSLQKDKKNTDSKINLILPIENKINRYSFQNNSTSLKLFRDVLLQTSISFVD